MAAKTLMTVEQFVQMETAEDESYELVDGELIPSPSATPLHGNIRGRLEHLVRSYFDRNPIGGTISEIDCRIGRNTVRKPDLCIFVADHWKELDLKKVPVPYAPDIAVEVFSPSEHIIEVNRKVRDYLSAGSQEVWLIDPENAELHVRTKSGVRILEGNQNLESALLPGFSVVVAALFAAR
jgi:Uma2 family endonuclease